ncbi:MAG: hypothetical protein AB3N12_00105 [Ruegeria sp.]
MKPREYLGDIANVVTLLGLPVTLVSLLNLFQISTITLTLPKVPGANAFLLLVFFLISVAFAKTFARWLAFFDTKAEWPRLVTIPTLALFSVTQTFVLIEVLFGSFGKQVEAVWYAVLVVIAVSLELYFLLQQKLPQPFVLLASKVILVTVFVVMLVYDADPSESHDTTNMLGFVFIYTIGMIFTAFPMAFYALDQQ